MDSVFWMFVLLALGIVGWSFSRFSQTLVHELRPGMTRDKIRAQLEGLSLRVGLMPRHVPEERATSGHERSIGALSLDHPLIRWVNITKEHTDPGGDADDFVEWFACFGVPDARLAERDLSGFSLHLASLRKIRLYGSPIGIRWKGHDRGLGVLDALENAIPEGSEEELPRPISVRAYPDLSCWTISVLALDNSSPHMEVKAPSRELWSLIERIASTLLAQELPDPRQQRGGTGAR